MHHKTWPNSYVQIKPSTFWPPSVHLRLQLLKSSAIQKSVNYDNHHYQARILRWDSQKLENQRLIHIDGCHKTNHGIYDHNITINDSPTPINIYHQTPLFGRNRTMKRCRSMESAFAHTLPINISYQRPSKRDNSYNIHP